MDFASESLTRVSEWWRQCALAHTDTEKAYEDTCRAFPDAMHSK